MIRRSETTDDNVSVIPVRGPVGMLAYATNGPWYVAFRGAGPSPRVEKPTLVDGVRQEAGEVHTSYGWIKVERVTSHFRPGVALSLSAEAAAVLAGFVHVPTDEHACIFASDSAWEELEQELPRQLFDDRRKSDPDFFDPEAGT